jgi:biotin transport system substrate-specific component
MTVLAPANSTIVDRVISRSLTSDIALIFTATLLTALSAQVVIPMFPVPMTGQTFSVLLVAATLGVGRASIAMVLYVAIGSFGAPVFAAGGFGFFGYTTGYLIGFIASAVVVGLLAQRGWDKTPAKVAAMFSIGSLVIYASGVSWLAIYSGLQGASSDLALAIGSGMVPFLIGDAAKAALAAALLPGAWAVVRKFKG